MLLLLPVVHTAPAELPGKPLLQIRWHRKKALTGESAPGQTLPQGRDRTTGNLNTLSDAVSPPPSERKVRAGASKSRWVPRAPDNSIPSYARRKRRQR